MNKGNNSNSNTTPKSTGAEVEARITKVYALLSNGCSRNVVLQYAAKNKWGVNTRQVDNYIKSAKKELLKNANVHRGYELGRSLARLDQLYFHAWNQKNYCVCLGIIKERNRILGIGVTKAEITTTNESINTPTATEIAKEIMHLKDLEETEKIN